MISLVAYDANNLSKMLVNVALGTFDNHLGGGYFGVPTVINGKVYVGTGRSISVFGLH